MAVTKYSKKPEVVDAIEYDGANAAEVRAFCPYVNEAMKLYGMDEVLPGMWILKDFGGGYRTFAANFLDYYKPGGGP